MKYFRSFIFLINLIVGIGCADSSNERVIKNDSITKSRDKITVDSAKLPSVKKIDKADITVKIYFRTLDMSGHEGYEDYKPVTSERTDFRKKYTYTACYDSEEFNNLQILGRGENLSLEIINNNKIIFLKKNINLFDKIIFTQKDFTVGNGDEHKIIIRQGKDIIFKGDIKSQGCM